MEKILKVRKSYQGKILSIEEVDIDFGNGKNATFEQVSFNVVTGVSALVIDDDQNIVLVRHFKLGAGKRILTLPTGGLEKGEDPKKRMQEELQEEIGFKAEELTLMTRAYSIPGYVSTQPSYIFLAQKLTNSKLVGDEIEDIEVVKIPYNKTLAMVKSGKIIDGRTTLALLFYNQFFK